MSLRSLAASDAKTIVKDGSTGFGWPFSLTSPTGEVFELTGRHNDIHVAIDPDTGAIVSDRGVTVTYVTSDVSESVTAPYKGNSWKVKVSDVNGVEGKFRVMDVFPDSTLGVTVLHLEVLNNVD